MGKMKMAISFAQLYCRGFTKDEADADMCLKGFKFARMLQESTLMY